MWLAAAALMALSIGYWAFQRFDALGLARNGERLIGKIESVQVRHYVFLPDSYYLYYTYSPPGSSPVTRGIRVTKQVSQSVRAGMPVEVRLDRGRKDHHITIPYHVEAATDWSRPVLFSLVAIWLLSRGWAEYRDGHRRQVVPVR
jgi:hypothetical protein